jgi:hypothetical protein
MPEEFLKKEYFSPTEKIEPKESGFYKKLTHLTAWACEQLDAAREEAFNSDFIERTKYAKDFIEEFGNFSRPVLRKEFLEKAKTAQIVFGGDDHDLEKSTENLVKVLEHIKSPDLIVGVECIEVEKQKIIDNYLDGIISEKDFLEKSGLSEFIPFQTKKYLEIFKEAKKVGIKVIALNKEPVQKTGRKPVNNEERTKKEEERLKKIDEEAAKIVVKEFGKNKNCKMYVIFGQYHLADNHLPAKIFEKIPNLSSLVFVQDVEPLYNQALEKFGQVPLIAGVAEIAKNKFAILDVSPLEIRYERFKNKFFSSGERKSEAIDNTLEKFFPDLLSFLSKSLDLDFKTLCFRYENGDCEKTIFEILQDYDIGYEDKGLEKKLSKKEKGELKNKKFVSFIEGDAPHLIFKDGFKFKDFVWGSMELIFKTLDMAGLRKYSAKKDEALIYLGCKIVKPDLKPKNKKEKEGEKLWNELFAGGEIKII